MKIWIISDTHFSHNKMIEYCGRPENFNELLWGGLKMVGKDDMLIHLGDFCIGKNTENHVHFRDGVNGKKILVRGNHDRNSNSWYLSHGWDFVCDHFVGNYFGKKIMFSHTPQKYNNNFDLNIHGHFHNALPRLLRGEWKVDGKKERNEQDLINLIEDKHKLLALEHVGYKPILLETFINKL